MEDSRILELLWQRAESAISSLVHRFGKRIYSTALNLVNNPQDAEECVNDTYMAIWNTIPPKRPQPLAPYVYRTSRNIALNRLRHNSAQKRSAYELSLEELAQYIPAPYLEDSRLLGQGINQYLDCLSKQNRIMFVRRYWFGDSVKDIAADFGMKENAVSVRLSRIREGLKEYLTKEGLL